MTDRLPLPFSDAGAPHFGERSSATPAKALPHDAVCVTAEGRGHPGAARNLNGLQRWLVSAIIGSDESVADASAVLSASPSLAARERLEVYRLAYRARLAECLEDDYREVAATLGDETFTRLASEYIDRFPSCSPNLNAFGRHFAAFCGDRSWLGDVRHFIRDLARLEWSLVEVIHARATAGFDLADLQALSPAEWGKVRLTPSDTVRLLRLAFPVNAYFQARRAGGCPNVPAREPSATAVYRRGLVLWRMDLTPAMTRVLKALLSSRPLEEAIAQLGVDAANAEEVGEAERSVSAWFAEWVRAGFFRGIAR